MHLEEQTRIDRDWPTRLLLSVGICLVAAVLGIVGMALYDARQSERRQAEQEAKNLVLGLERDLGRAIDTFDLSILAAREGLKHTGIAELAPALRQSVLFDGAIAAEGFGGIVITDKAGTIIYDSVGPTPRHLNISERNYFKDARDRPDMGLAIGAPIKNMSKNEWTLGLARSYQDADGHFAGVIAGGLQLSFVQGLFNSLQLGELGTISLSNLKGRVLARQPYSEQDLGRDTSKAEVFRRLGQASSGIFVSRAAVDGMERLYAYRQVGQLPMVISVGMATDTIYGEWVRKTAVIAGALRTLLLVGVALSFALRAELRRRARAEQAAKRSEQRHAEALARLDALFQNSDDSMLVARLDSTGVLVYDAVNPVWERMMGVSSACAIGTTPSACLPNGLAKTIAARWEQCRNERRPVTFGFETQFDGPLRAWETKIVPILDAMGTVSRLIGVGRDVTQRKAAEEQLAALNFELSLQATTDGLTGLANRRRLDEALDLEWRRAARDGSPLSMMMIDLDRFKLFNDRYGHQQGDACLQAVAKILGSCVRRPGDIAARYGGEELGVLLPKTGIVQATALAERVRAAIEAVALSHEGNAPFGVVTASIGVATIRPFASRSSDAAAELLSAADEALYEAKHAGRNRVVMSRRVAAEQTVRQPQLSA